MSSLFSNFLILGMAISLLSACASTVETQNVQVTELEKLDSDYTRLPGTSGWVSEGEFSGKAISDVNMLDDKSFWAISFSSPDDLESMAADLDGNGLTHHISPCDGQDKIKDSRYSGGVLLPSIQTSEVKKYYVFVPKSLREAMHAQSRIDVLAYRDYMKEAISKDKAEDLCLFIGAIQYYSFKKFEGRVGSLEELGIVLN